MDYLNRLKVGRKVAVGYIAVVLAVVIVAVVILISLVKLTGKFSFMVEHDMPVIENSLRLHKLMVDMETGQRGFLITGKEEFLEPYHAGLKEFDRLMDKEKKLVSDNPPQVKKLEEIQELKGEWLRVAAEPEIGKRRLFNKAGVGMGNPRAVTIKDVSKLVEVGTGKAILDKIRNTFTAFDNVENELNLLRSRDAKQTANLTIGITILMVFLSVGLSLVVGIRISRSITGPLGKLLDASEAVAGGDLDRSLIISSRDEVGTLATAFNQMTDRLREMFAAGEEQRVEIEKRAAGEAEQRQNVQQQRDNLEKIFVQITEVARNLSSATAEILAATTEQAATASEQSAAVIQTSTTVEQARQTSRQSAERATEVARMAQDSSKEADRGSGAVESTLEGVNSIKEQVQNIAENILSLSEQTQQIGEIIDTVNDIADQSNLLALNAAIEAARAGEAGKGFAVVAGEVGSLAVQSRGATAQVQEILGEIQKAANTAVMVTEEGTKRADLGVIQAQKAGNAIETINRNIQGVNQTMQQMAASSREQLAGMDQITNAMESIGQATTQTETGTRQVEGAAKNLNVLAEQLNRVVDQYKSR